MRSYDRYISWNSNFYLIFKYDVANQRFHQAFFKSEEDDEEETSLDDSGTDEQDTSVDPPVEDGDEIGEDETSEPEETVEVLDAAVSN
jgi:hypothetical protein